MYEKGHEDDEETVDKSPFDPCACYGIRMHKEEGYDKESKDRGSWWGNTAGNGEGYHERYVFKE